MCIRDRPFTYGLVYKEYGESGGIGPWKEVPGTFSTVAEGMGGGHQTPAEIFTYGVLNDSAVILSRNFELGVVHYFDDAVGADDYAIVNSVAIFGGFYEEPYREYL